MKLLVGLGNPGPKYELTRHNAGFLILDLIAVGAKIPWEGGSNKFGGEIAKGTFNGQTCVFLKPMTFMNLSGRSVRAVTSFFKIEPKDVICLHDELDVPAGKVKARVGGGAGGHNGIRSMIEELGSADFHRIKLGIGKPPPQWQGADWVLGRFADEELLALQEGMYQEVLVRLKSIFDQSK